MQVIANMNGIKPLTLSRAVLVYEGERDGVTGQAKEALVTINDVRIERGLNGVETPQIKPGQLLSRDTLTSLTRSLHGLPQKREILPANVLFYDAGRMVWHVPARLRPIWFSPRLANLNKTIGGLVQGLNGREVLYPPLLFVAEPGDLFVFALTSNERPTADTPVYAAPVLNVYDTGHMCRGNVALPQSLAIADLAKWEAGLYDTQFTHSNYRAVTICKHPRGHDGLWRSLAWRQEWRGFPNHLLTPLMSSTRIDGKQTPLTVGEVVSRVAK
jgi:PRTRC genetic system protein B